MKGEENDCRVKAIPPPPQKIKINKKKLKNKKWKKWYKSAARQIAEGRAQELCVKVEAAVLGFRPK